MKSALHRCAALVLLVLALVNAAPTRADTVDQLVALIRQSSSTGNPAMAFLQGLGRLGDFSLGQADIRRALTESGAPAGGMIEKLLSTTRKLTKRGAHVQIDRTQETTLSPLTPDGKGAVKIGKTVKLRLRVQGSHDATIDDVSGLQVGETRDELYDLWNVKFTREGGRPVAKVTAGALIFSKTVTIDLSPSATPARSTNPVQPRRGLTDAVDRNVTSR